MNIGIIGQGYVGSAIKIGFEPHYNIETYDKYDEDKSTCDLTELVETCKVIFVCVPTPMNTDGTCHTDIVESVVKDIDDRQKQTLLRILKIKKELYWVVLDKVLTN